MFGMKITFSALALEDTDVRQFPASKHRSKRVHKKLLKRFGSEFKKEPCIWHTPHGLIAHPSFRQQLEKSVESRYTFPSW